MDYERMAPFARAILAERGHFEKQAQLVRRIAERFHVPYDARILDAACGTGDVLIALNELGFKNLTGLYGSREMLEQRQPNTPPVSQCKWADLHQYFSGHGQFDFVYMLGHALPHAEFAEIEEVLKTIQDGLKKGGIFAFDMRAWDELPTGQLTQLGRLDGQFRSLGTVEVDGKNWSVEDMVRYHAHRQNVTYRMACAAERVQFDLSYSLFTVKMACDALIKAGFQPERVFVEDSADWPYTTIIARLE